MFEGEGSSFVEDEVFELDEVLMIFSQADLLLEWSLHRGWRYVIDLQ